MKLYKRLSIFILTIIAAATFSTATVFAEDVVPDDNNQTSSAPQVTPDPGNGNTQNPDSTPVPDPEPDPVPPPQDPGVNTPDNTPSADNGNNNNYDNNYSNGGQTTNNDYDNYYGTYSVGPYVVDRENDYYQPGTPGEDSTQPVVDNKLYNADLSNDSDEMSADDWDIALDLDETSDGADFNFIKENNSKDDSVLYQLMLFGGVLLITISIFGIILIIIMTARTSKRNKVILAKASAAKGKQSATGTIGSMLTLDENESQSVSGKKDVSKYDTAEIDLSKYDKYL